MTSWPLPITLTATSRIECCIALKGVILFHDISPFSMSELQRNIIHIPGHSIYRNHAIVFPKFLPTVISAANHDTSPVVSTQQILFIPNRIPAYLTYGWWPHSAIILPKSARLLVASHIIDMSFKLPDCHSHPYYNSFLCWLKTYSWILWIIMKIMKINQCPYILRLETLKVFEKITTEPNVYKTPLIGVIIIKNCD